MLKLTLSTGVEGCREGVLVREVLGVEVGLERHSRKGQVGPLDGPRVA